MVALRRLAALAIAVAVPRAAQAHPLHTTLTEVTEDRAHGTVRGVIRVFADDFGTALARSLGGRGVPTGAAWDAAATTYATSRFGFVDRGGRAVALHSCGVTRQSGLLWICIEGTTAETLANLRVRNGVLCDLFEDQINVIQGVVSGARHSVLFTRGDGPKPLA